MIKLYHRGGGFSGLYSYEVELNGHKVFEIKYNIWGTLAARDISPVVTAIAEYLEVEWDGKIINQTYL